ncbi:MAG: hypothetical protein NDJ90_10340 [Oligoflexia bacterium]|nr:hypothetical protein [Oligoflexia bacterium]
MKTWKKAYRLPLYLSIAALLSACGANPYHESAMEEETTVPGASTSTPDTSTDTSGTGTTTTSDLLPSLKYSFSVTGSKGTKPAYSVTVNTDNLLKVKITAEAAAPQTMSGFTANYGCVTYIVTALGEPVYTETLTTGAANNFNCRNAPTSQVIDFSDRLQPGHGAVSIEVRASQYDFYWNTCVANPWAYPYGCQMYYPLYNVYQNHQVRGKLAIQVNGTTL